ncbi:adenylate/guanylate cyclase domain-containing protein [Phyllobacterium sp. YR531]|uniref:adenylate/guanylate cyclase domain-containing protein n=1 Tax=Phyllobacterium sp. YR531 TaxID=1144343 RepID=UPI00026F7592|nr:adenylate/guanylate cyclase domain-containing protein [Phyllobacterium sp. YR531]EJN02078.1 family 3 adenylate cyclase [Phyllobacterium sp. YR531]
MAISKTEEPARFRNEQLKSSYLTNFFLQISQNLVKASLNGLTDNEIVALLGTSLSDAGVNVSTIEIACDVVDPEADLHRVRWHRDASGRGNNERSTDIFSSMLEEDVTTLRLNAKNTQFASVLVGQETDAIAFANHLEPDVTIGFFDDVMSLFITNEPDGFKPSDIDLLHLITPVFALALGARLNASAARTLLQTYLGSDAATAMLDGRVGLGDVDEIRAIVLFCDLVDFTHMTEGLAPQSLISNLNLFFETVTRPLSRAGGQVSGYVGDGVVMFFPITNPANEDVQCATAINAALEGLRALDSLNDSSSRNNLPKLRARIGIDIGEVVHGNIGSAGRFSFTIIGSPVNRAARLQALAKDLGAILLMSCDLASRASIECTAFGNHSLRGFDRPVDVVGFLSSS